MPSFSTLTTLIDLAEKEVNETAIQLGEAIQSGDELQKKLTLLKRYREDYSLKMQAELKEGREIQRIRNFQRFLEKIDVAIEGQQQLVIYAQQQIQIEQQRWQEQERKKMSYVTLEERAEKVMQKKEARRDQLQNDEYGVRQLFYK